MPLSLVSTTHECLVCPAVEKALAQGLGKGGAVLLVPSFSAALEAQTCLARQAGLSVGIEVGTPISWARDRWDVWGDGRRMVGDDARSVLIKQVLDASWEEGACPSGTVRLLCDLAKRALPWVADALAHAGDLTATELRLVKHLPTYQALLDERGLIESCTIMTELPRALRVENVRVPPVVVAGFDELSCAERMFVAGLAELTHVTYVFRSDEGVAWRLAASTAQTLRDLARQRNIPLSEGVDAVGSQLKREPELARLVSTLFDAASARLTTTGAVRLLASAGPLAEAELVAGAVKGLANEGMRHVVVAVPDVRRAWRELAPKLVARGVGVQARMSVPVLQTRAGSAFMGYARSVARLVALDSSWPQPVWGTDGQLIRLGDMSWWPPKELVDFLLSDVSWVEASRAYALDAAWRSNRLLSPADVLAQLLNAKQASEAVERATRELLRGRLGSAASKLLAPYQPAASSQGSQPATASSLLQEEAIGVLAAVLGVAGTLKELGITADPAQGGAISLGELVGQAEQALAGKQVTLRPEVRTPHEAAIVVLVSREQAACLPPASADALVVCGLTSEEYAVPTGDDVLGGLLEAMGVERKGDPLASMRASFARLLAVPRRRVLLERSLLSADAKDTYPAVMLTEVLARYNADLPCTSLDEGEPRVDVSATGLAPSPETIDEVSAAGRISDDLRRLVVVPQEGRTELAGGLPVLSASQLETYLECPLKWFSLRRLRLRDNDATFSPVEMGTFVHRVLELTHLRLLAEACEAAHMDPQQLAEGDFTLSLAGSRPIAEDERSVAHAQDVLASCFDLHLEHQYLRTGSRAAYQALVAHSARERGQLDRLRRDLASEVAYESGLLRGYEPRLFEWGFGRGDNSVSYAGVRVTGTVDRVDVDAHGHAVIVDYKHKGTSGFFAEYAALPEGGHVPGEELVLPRRIQALMYAQIIRRAFPQLKVVGALYLATRSPHELSGAADANLAENIFASKLSARRAERVLIRPDESFGCADATGMDALLDATERSVAAQVEMLRAGNIEARPRDASSCAYCPVMNCERRRRA